MFYMRVDLLQIFINFRRSVRKLFQALLAIIIFIASQVSCNNFPAINVSRNILQPDNARKEKYKKNNFLKRYSIPASPEKSYPVHAVKFNQVYNKRLFAESFSFSPLAYINSKGINLALNGRYTEAEILFTEALEENAAFAEACNNLGIIHELQNKNDNAFDMYSKACIIDPENKVFKLNFLYFCDKQ
jgi:tetratricopeptide (TPR) repeat protein